MPRTVASHNQETLTTAPFVTTETLEAGLWLQVLREKYMDYPDPYRAATSVTPVTMASNLLRARHDLRGFENSVAA